MKSLSLSLRATQECCLAVPVKRNVTVDFAVHTQEPLSAAYRLIALTEVGQVDQALRYDLDQYHGTLVLTDEELAAANALLNAVEARIQSALKEDDVV